MALRLDGLGLLFGLIVTGCRAAVLVYAGAYLQDDPLLGRFFGYLLAFMASMLGLVLAGRLTHACARLLRADLAVFLPMQMIAHEHERREARAAAQQALLITTVGGLCLSQPHRARDCGDPAHPWSCALREPARGALP
ncbi:MAG: hypothetical protein KIT58_00560 [Planctomycetota bacterium]|nr:hypothetical protein [Planctomycetota bacterium]